MARSSNGVNQSAFIREKLSANPGIKYRDVADAWKEAKLPGEIKSSLFYLVKNKMGSAKTAAPKRRGRPPKNRSASISTAAAPSASAGDAAEIYREIEHKLDVLIHRAMLLHNLQLAENLLVARRRASIHLV
jgi:hypothetical protein